MKLKLDWENVFRPIEEVVVEFVGFEEDYMIWLSLKGDVSVHCIS